MFQRRSLLRFGAAILRHRSLHCGQESRGGLHSRQRPRGCHLITREILRNLPTPLPRAGLLNIFVKHTSCALTINENADPDVLTDLDAILDRLVPDSQPYYTHTMEGPDDMSAHAKSTLTGVSLSIPVTDGRLNLGIWQGIYLCEFRDRATPRTIVLTLIS